MDTRNFADKENLFPPFDTSTEKSRRKNAAVVKEPGLAHGEELLVLEAKDSGKVERSSKKKSSINATTKRFVFTLMGDFSILSFEGFKKTSIMVRFYLAGWKFKLYGINCNLIYLF